MAPPVSVSQSWRGAPSVAPETKRPAVLPSSTTTAASGSVAPIAADGAVLESYVPQRFKTLPQVVGKGAEKQAADFLQLLSRYPGIALLVEASVLVAERRWNLHLQGGIEVLLPEAQTERALTTLIELASRQLFSRDIVAVDLRLADRVTVRLSDAAAAARKEAINAADKDKKKRKGTDA